MLDRFEKFSFAISDIYRYWHNIATDVMEQYGLKGPYVVYFTTMSRYAEGITATKLGELCGRDKSDVSRAVSVLEKKGLIKKEGDGPSLYRARLILTDEGKSLADIINKKAEGAVDFVGHELTDENRRIFYDCLEKIVNNLQIASEKGLPR